MKTEWRNKVAYKKFKSKAVQNPRLSCKAIKFDGFEWPQNVDRGLPIPKSGIEQLRGRHPCPVRIICAPLLHPSPMGKGGKGDLLDVDCFLGLFSLYSVPAAFVLENLRNVTCSFGTSWDGENTEYSWFHFLCKNIEVQEAGDGVKRIVNRNRKVANDFSQADYSWARCACCMKIQSNGMGRYAEITLIVFSVGAGLELRDKIGALARNTSWQEVIEDPYYLFTVVLESLLGRITKIVEDFGGVFAQEENKVLESAVRPGFSVKELDFVGLHMLSKHIIYLSEGTEAAMTTISSIMEHHQRISKVNLRPDAGNQTQASFRYQKTLLKSTTLRLKSLERRSKNIINLSFNLVTQADSKALKSDSYGMKNVAIMGLVFLPFQAVTTLFSTPFFYFEDKSSIRGALGVSTSVGLVWAISVPLTIAVLSGWYLFQMKHERRKFSTLFTY